MFEQGSDEWFAARLGKITSSKVSDVMAKTKSGPAATRKNYMMQLLCERLTGRREESFTSPAMQRGTDQEPIARSAYEIATGSSVSETGFIIHPEYNFTGSSPDGLVCGDGLVEIKNPNTAQHIASIQSGSYDRRYYPQMQHQLWVSDREWCDFVSFDDRLPDSLQLFIDRVYRSAEYISDMVDEILEFHGELLKLELLMLDRMEKSA